MKRFCRLVQTNSKSSWRSTPTVLLFVQNFDQYT